MKRFVALVVLLCVVGVVPVVALDKFDGVCLTIAAFDLGIGVIALKQKSIGAKIIGGFALALGVFGVVSVACGWYDGDLLCHVRTEVGY